MTTIIEFGTPGTAIKFQPPLGRDTMSKNGEHCNVYTRSQCITAMPEYGKKSLEELRLEDYDLGRKSSLNPIQNDLPNPFATTTKFPSENVAKSTLQTSAPQSSANFSKEGFLPSNEARTFPNYFSRPFGTSSPSTNLPSQWPPMEGYFSKVPNFEFGFPCTAPGTFPKSSVPGSLNFPTLSQQAPENRCNSKNEKFEVEDSYEATTKFSHSKLQFKWTISDFSQQTFPLVSPKFGGSHKYERQGWKLCLNKAPDFNNFGRMTYTISIINDSPVENKTQLKYKLYVPDCEGKATFVLDHFYDYIVPFYNGGILNVGPLNLFSFTQANPECDHFQKSCSPNGELTIIAELAFRRVVSKSSLTSSFHKPLEATAVQKKWAESQQQVFKTYIPSDVQLICKGGEKAYAHKAVLSAHSPFLESLLSRDADEQTGKIQISLEDFEHKTVENTLNFLYTGNIAEALTNLNSLTGLKFAHLCGLDSFKDLLESKLVSTLNIENACEMFIVGDSYSFKLIRKAALDFISKNISSLSKREDFKALMKKHPELVIECLQTLSL